MRGIIDVGGGLRGIYGAGVFDAFLDQGIDFDVCIGVSAGSANLASFLAGQKGRNYQFYNDYSFRKEYISLGNKLRDGSYLDLDYVYRTLSNRDGENPLDYPSMVASGHHYYVVATNALTGKPHYFGLDDFSLNDYAPLAASCCVPIANKPYCIAEVPYFDGGVADPIPIQKALGLGCDHVTVVLTRPRDYYRTQGRDKFLSRLLRRSYPQAAVALKAHADRYNQQLDLVKEYEGQGKVTIIAPDTVGKMGTFTRDHAQLDQLYKLGYEDGMAYAEKHQAANSEHICDCH